MYLHYGSCFLPSDHVLRFVHSPLLAHEPRDHRLAGALVLVAEGASPPALYVVHNTRHLGVVLSCFGDAGDVRDVRTHRSICMHGELAVTVLHMTCVAKTMK